MTTKRPEGVNFRSGTILRPTSEIQTPSHEATGNHPPKSLTRQMKRALSPTIAHLIPPVIYKLKGTGTVARIPITLMIQNL